MTEYDHILEIRFSGPELEEMIEGLLYLTDSSGNVIEQDGDETVIRAFFADDDARRSAYLQLNELDDVALNSYDTERLDWLARYQQSLQPISVGKRFVVAPDESLLSGSDAIPIVVPQERAFGTGSHETTWLCLNMLDDAKLRDRRCVDIGTGSGILAIGMHKLGAARVFAFDNDIETFGTVASNLARNGVTTREVTEFFGGPEALATASVDYATMNIIPEVIIPLLADVRRALRDRGTILFSGILIERKQDVIDAAAANALHFVRDETRGEWWCGEFTAA